MGKIFFKGKFENNMPHFQFVIKPIPTELWYKKIQLLKSNSIYLNDKQWVSEW